MNNELTSVWNSFISSVAKNKNLTDLYMKLDSGSATYKEAQEFSSSLSSYLVDWLAKEYPNDSKKVLDALKDTNICKNFYKKIDDYVYKAQKDMNVANNLGMNAVKVIQPSQILDQDTTYTDDFKKDIETFANKAELSSNKHVDTIQQANAKFQSKAGFGVTVSRKYDGRGLSDGRSCKWCLERAKSNVPYDQAVKSGMFQRHEGCHCMIEYNNNGKKSYQNGIGGRDSWNTQQNWMAKQSIKVGDKKVSVHDFKDYDNIKTQTNSSDAQNTAKIVNEIVNVQKKYGNVDKVVILKNKTLGGIAAYDYTKNTVYLSEELGQSNSAKRLIDSNIFPAKNLEDVLEHELGGHKQHWDYILEYAQEKGISIDSAKETIESNLRKYVTSKMAYDPYYIQKVVSLNAYDNFYSKKELNELIADAKVKIRKNELYDDELTKLVTEVVNYDGGNA